MSTTTESSGRRISFTYSTLYSCLKVAVLLPPSLAFAARLSLTVSLNYYNDQLYCKYSILNNVLSRNGVGSSNWFFLLLFFSWQTYFVTIWAEHLCVVDWIWLCYCPHLCTTLYIFVQRVKRKDAIWTQDTHYTTECDHWYSAKQPQDCHHGQNSWLIIIRAHGKD